MVASVLCHDLQNSRPSLLRRGFSNKSPMDRVFGAGNKPFISPLVSIDEFRRTAEAAEIALYDGFGIPSRRNPSSHPTEPSTSSAIPPHSGIISPADERQLTSALTSITGIGEEDALRLLSDTSISLLAQGTRDRCYEWTHMETGAPAHVVDAKLVSTLASHEAIRSRYTHMLTSYSNLRETKSVYRKNLRYFGCPSPLSSSRGAARTVEPDVLLDVYVGFAQQDRESVHRRPNSASSRIVVRGDTTLLRLRQRLMCVADISVIPSANDQQLEPPSLENAVIKKYPSAFIFINDTFFVDLRADNAADTSIEIREWMYRNKCFDKVRGVLLDEATRIGDLNLRLGMPYVFCHAANCEHVLVFSNLRYTSVADNVSPESYPICTVRNYASVHCCACHAALATYVVEGSDRMPFYRGMFCERCLRTFHYNGDTPVGQFRVYHYYQSVELR